MTAIHLRIAPHWVVGLVSFIGGCLTHWFLLSASDAAPKKLAATLAHHRGQIGSLQTAIDESRLAADELARQNQSCRERLARLERDRNELDQSFSAYRTQAEKERAEHRQMKAWVHRELQYRAPANVDDILAIRGQFDALAESLPAADFKRLEKTSAYQNLAAVLSRLPRSGL